MTDDDQGKRALGVDGSRPSVGWVAALPGEWTTTPQRLILFALACDAFEDTSRPRIDNLSSWCGLSRNRTFEVLAQLCRPEVAADGTLIRPPLVQRVDKQGQPLPEGRNYGRERVGFRLLWNVNGTDARPGREVEPLEAERYGQPSGQRYGEQSRAEAESGTTPFPSLPSSSSASEVTTDRAPADDDAGIVEAARRVAAVAADAGKRWGERGIAKYLRTLVQDMTLADAEGQAARSASDPGAKTPEAITFEKYQATRPAVEQPSEPTCRVCGLTRTGHDRNRDNTGDPHGWEPVGGESASTGESPNPQEEQVGEVERGPADEPLPEQPGQDQPDAVSDQQPAEPTSEPQTAPPAGPPAAPGAEPSTGWADPSAGQQSRPKARSAYELLAAQLGDQAPVRVPVTTAAPAA